MRRFSASNVWRLALATVFLAFVSRPDAVAAGTNTAPALEVADHFLLAIPKSGFGKDYIFSASTIPQGSAPTSHGLAGKIVRFELYPDGVDMYESTEGLVVTADLPARRLLASFAIVTNEANRVVVDFNQGMRRVFMQSWTDGGELDLGQHDSVLEVPESRVFEMRQDGAQLVIRQSVQARSREFEQDVETRLEERYFIMPYEPGTFVGKEPNKVDDRYARFFETEGHLETGTGRISSRIDRFDLKEPVVFYYSANTPPEYVEAVKDGILYWNRAFGKDVVQAKPAPAGVTAPDAKYNVVQWVPWDRAGFAYADVLSDPLNGESLHGQVYMTSAFTFLGKARARALLRTMEEIAEPKKDDKKKAPAQFGLPFLSSSDCCEVDQRAFAQQMAHGLQDMLASDQLTDEAVLRVSQDYVREVIAHEVGHILGLRHNFAGSLAGTMTSKDLDDWFRAYLLGQPVDAYTNKFVSTAMMEYTVFKGGAFIGWQMRTTKLALPHDQAAIRWGYFDDPAVRTNKLLFASDEDMWKYADVRTFDYGPDPVVGAYDAMASVINLLPNNIIETFIRARAPQNPNDRIPLENVALNYSVTANDLASDFADALQWFSADTRSLRVENSFDYIGELNKKERQKAHWKDLNRQIDLLGGVDRALFSELPEEFKLDLKDPSTNEPVIPRLSSKNLAAKLEKLLVSTNYSTFVGLDDKKYSFTKDEQKLIIERGELYFDKLEGELVKQLCKRLEDAPRNLGVEANGGVSDDDIVTKLEDRIIEIAKHVVMAKDDDKRLEGKMDKAFVSVPLFKYDQETRLAAAKMLNERTGSYKSWADDAKGDLNGELKKAVEDALNIDHFKDFKVSQLSRPLRDWYQQQIEILNMLPPGPSAGPGLPNK